MDKNYIKQLLDEVQNYETTERLLIEQIKVEYDFFARSTIDLIVDGEINAHIIKQEELVKTLSDIKYIKAEKLDILKEKLKTYA